MARGTNGFKPDNTENQYSSMEEVASNKSLKSSSDTKDHSKITINTDAFITTKKKEPKILKGFYLEQEVAKAIEKIAKKKGTRGANSEFVNQILKEVLKANGYLE